MSDNLTNLIKSALFSADVTVTTSDSDVSPIVIQPAQMAGQEKYNLDQRDSLSVLLFAVSGTVTAGATITANYYARFPSAINDSKLLSTETIIAPEITAGGHYVARFASDNLTKGDADYCTLSVVLKEAVGTNYRVAGQVAVKKKIVKEPLVNVAAPTTATVGKRGDVIFDTDGNRWELIAVIGSLYYWKPNYIPANDTKYPFAYSNGVMIWQIKKSFTTKALSGTDTIVFNSVASSVEEISGMLSESATSRFKVGTFLAANTTWQVNQNGTNTIASTVNTYTGWLSKPAFVEIKFREV